jgi:putative tryptophan/tyrosine transport system substrate-binding protein
MPLIGFLHSAPAEPYTPQADASRLSLKEAGYVEGQNVAIEYRWADNQIARLPKMAAELQGAWPDRLV